MLIMLFYLYKYRAFETRCCNWRNWKKATTHLHSRSRIQRVKATLHMCECSSKQVGIVFLNCSIAIVFFLSPIPRTVIVCIAVFMCRYLSHSRPPPSISLSIYLSLSLTLSFLSSPLVLIFCFIFVSKPAFDFPSH